MSDEPKESRVSIEDLPQWEQELTPEEAKEVKGGRAANLQIADLTSVAIDPRVPGGYVKSFDDNNS